MFIKKKKHNKFMFLLSTGAMSGGFSFQVTDGLNFAPRQIFSITARPLVISLEVNKGLRVFPGLFLIAYHYFLHLKNIS